MADSVPTIGELGTTGLKQYSGYVREEFIRELKGRRAAKIYREMRDNDSVVGAIMFVVEMLLRGVSFYIEPANNTDRDALEAADFVQSCLDDMQYTWEDTLSEVLSFLTYGYAWHEIVYKRRRGYKRDPAKSSKHDDGRLGWQKFAPRSQDTLLRWQFDDHDEVTAFVQQPPTRGGQVIIPAEKSLHFITRSRKRNPEGVSVLRNAYRAWYFKSNIEQVEGIGVERDLAGLPVVYAPPEWTDANATGSAATAYNELKEMVRNIRRDEQEGILLPMIYERDAQGNPTGQKRLELTLLSTGGRRQFDTDKIVQRYDRRIAMTILADFVLLGHEKVGSFALASSKTSLFSHALRTFADVIVSQFNQHAIPDLLRLNGVNLDMQPRITYGDIESPDLQELGEYINKLVGAGVIMPDDKLEQYARGVASMPERGDGDLREVGDQNKDEEDPLAAPDA